MQCQIFTIQKNLVSQSCISAFLLLTDFPELCMSVNIGGKIVYNAVSQFGHLKQNYGPLLMLHVIACIILSLKELVNETNLALLISLPPLYTALGIFAEWI